jgi:diketogulonate reductase-like aldo/keto reductase
MEQRVFGWTGVSVPVVGQGTWQMELDDRASCVRAIHAGLDLGMTHVDTAELYGWGQVEQMLAEALEGRRQDVFLVSKVHPKNASHAGTLKACEETLKRLRTDHLDLYLLHWRGGHALEETFRAFETLVSAGKVRFVGVSNFGVADLEEALELLGPRKLACNQVEYHLEERAIERDVIPWCERHEMSVVGYSPFGAGRFPSPKSPGGKVLAELAKTHAVTPYQVALKYLTRRPSLFAIPKASTLAHVKDNAAADALDLTVAELDRVGRAFD